MLALHAWAAVSQRKRKALHAKARAEVRAMVSALAGWQGVVGEAVDVREVVDDVSRACAEADLRGVLSEWRGENFLLCL